MLGSPTYGKAVGGTVKLSVAQCAGTVLLMSAGVAAAGCASTEAHRKALDSYVREEQSTLPKLEKRYPGVFSHVEVEAVYPRTAQITSDYAQVVDPLVETNALRKQIPTLKSTCKEKILPAMERAGIRNPRMRFIWRAGDGSTLLTYTCERS